jgi:hypothetical protein
MNEQKRPMAGEWWFLSGSEAGDAAKNAGYFVKHALPDGTFIVQEDEHTIPSECSIWTMSDFEGLVHEPLCNGWEWVVPERQETSESADQLLLLTAEHDYLKSAMKNVRTEMRKVFGVTTRRFASICGVTCEQLSKWTGDVPEEKPDFLCKIDEQNCSAPASPEDWVTQDKVPARPGIDERRYRYSDGSCGAWDDSAVMNWSKPAKHGDRSLGGSSAVVELRCRRKDYPTVAETGEAVAPIPELKQQNDADDVVEIPVWLVTRPSGKRYLVVDDVIETLSGDKVQKCRPMRLEVLK